MRYEEQRESTFVSTHRYSSSRGFDAGIRSSLILDKSQLFRPTAQGIAETTENTLFLNQLTRNLDRKKTYGEFETTIQS